MSFLNAITTFLYSNEEVPDWYVHVWLELLKRVDYLVLDDFGKGDQAQWKKDFMYTLLDARDKTIITSNLSGAEMKKIFDASLVSRVAKGSKDLSFKYPQDSEDRRTLPF